MFIRGYREPEPKITGRLRGALNHIGGGLGGVVGLKRWLADYSWNIIRGTIVVPCLKGVGRGLTRFVDYSLSWNNSVEQLFYHSREKSDLLNSAVASSGEHG